MEMFIIAIFFTKTDFEQLQFQKVGMGVSFFHSGYKSSVYLFTTEVFIFADFVQILDIEWSQFQKVGIALSELFCLCCLYCKY